MKVYFGLAILPLMFISCTVSHVPQAPPLEPSRVPAIEAVEPVRWINAQNVQEDIVLSIDPYKLRVNLREYTESVIAALQSEFYRRNLPHSGPAVRVIEIAVVDVSMAPFAGGFVCNFDLSLKPADSPVIGIQASSRSIDYRKAIDYSVADAVGRILSHSEIVRYLEKR